MLGGHCHHLIKNDLFLVVARSGVENLGSSQRCGEHWALHIVNDEYTYEELTIDDH